MVDYDCVNSMSLIGEPEALRSGTKVFAVKILWQNSHGFL